MICWRIGEVGVPIIERLVILSYLEVFKSSSIKRIFGDEE
jgi:hypothetical protein